MESSVKKQALHYLKQKKNRRFYIAVLLCLAVVVAAGTAAALRKQGQAKNYKQKILNCQYKVHQHTKNCYDEDWNIVCGLADYAVHVHVNECYDADGALVCPLPEIEPHVHDDSCYQQEKVLVCDQTETEGHSHSDACYALENEGLTCNLAEHVHTDSCYVVTTEEDKETILICGMEEHEHSEDCYGWAEELVCGLEEEPAHIHTNDCYVTQELLSCGMLELHTHSEEACYEIDKDGNLYLTCEEIILEEHIHGPGCFITADTEEEEAEETEDTDQEEEFVEETEELLVECYNESGELICELEEHIHTEECLNADGEFACGLTEHVHKAGADTLFRKVYQDSDVIITAIYGPGANIPVDAELVAYRVTKESAPERYEQRQAEARAALGVNTEEDGPENVTADAEQEIPIYNIGFYLDGEELEPEEQVTFTVQFLDENGLIKGDVITIVHFGEEGTETIDGTVEEDGTATFVTDSLSDFAFYARDGGVQTYGVAETGLILYLSFDERNWNDSTGNATVTKKGDPGTDWVTGYDGTGYAAHLNGSGNKTAYAEVMKTNNTSLLNGLKEMTVSFYSKIDANQTNHANWPFFAAQSSNPYDKYVGFLENGSYQAERYNGGRTSATGSGSANGGRVDTSWHHVIVVFSEKQTSLWVDEKEVSTISTTASLTDILGSDSVLQIGKANWGDGEYLYGTIDEFKIYNYAFSKEKILGTEWPESEYPAAAKTLDPSITIDTFYNVTVDGEGLTGLKGVVYEIVETGHTFTTGSAMETKITGLEPGKTYTMRQKSVPEGYAINPETWEITVNEDGTIITMKEKSTGKSSGIIFNYKDGIVKGTKTAEEEDYAERTYRIDIEAISQAVTYSISDINVSLVVDQSNSMLFPADLDPTGMYINLGADYRDKNGKYDTQFNTVGMDKHTLYYVIADPNQSAAVYAIWWNGVTWLFQDAAYYYKAAWNELEVDDWVCFPRTGGDAVKINYGTKEGRNVIAFNGADLNAAADNARGTLKDGNYQLYTGIPDEDGVVYTRLTYLKNSLAGLVRELAILDPYTHISLTRFTSTVDSNCVDEDLSPAGVKKLLEAVSTIRTYGGTRQDKALKHVTGGTSDTGEASHNHILSNKKNYVVLITDGAPARSSGTTDSMETIITELGKAADKIKGTSGKSKTILATIGLSLGNVDLQFTGIEGLGDIDGAVDLMGKIATPDWSWASENSSELERLLLGSFFEKLVTPVRHAAVESGHLRDVISDSFYLIDPDNNSPLPSGTLLKLNGHVTKKESEAAGVVVYDEAHQEWYVDWWDQYFPALSDDGPSDTWHGTIYVKAKEDFIGGNAIDTNKEAYISVYNDGSRTDDRDNKYRIILNKPTVNVHLLSMNELYSEVTVFRGDTVNGPQGSDAFKKTPQESLKYLYSQIKFDKVTDGLKNFENVLNYKDWTTADQANCDYASFNLQYALGDLLEKGNANEEYEVSLARLWEKLVKDGEAVVEYTYDDASSHGPVGAFTFTVSKSGDYSEWGAHPAWDSGVHAETYTLTVTYEAYKLNEHGRPNENKYTGNYNTKKPGTMVDPAKQANTENDLKNGYGKLVRNLTHYVNVIAGQITVTKEISNDLVSQQDQFYKIRLTRLDEEGRAVEGAAVDAKVTIKAGETTGSVTFENLARAEYTVTEVVDEEGNYRLESIKAADGTNCYYTVDEKDILHVFMGYYNEAGEKKDVITYHEYDQNKVPDTAACPHETVPSHADAIQYSTWKDAVCNMAVNVYNTIKGVTVKIWKVSVEDNTPLAGAVFELYKDSDVTDGKLNEDAKPFWTGTSVKNSDGTGGWEGNNFPKLDVGTYYMREAETPDGYYPLAGLVKVTVDGKGKVIMSILNSTGLIAEEEINGEFVYYIQNSAGYELPKAGGTGVMRFYVFGGLLAVAAGALLVFRKRAKHS